LKSTLYLESMTGQLSRYSGGNSLKKFMCKNIVIMGF
jgi:hypothetical protein